MTKMYNFRVHCSDSLTVSIQYEFFRVLNYLQRIKRITGPDTAKKQYSDNLHFSLYPNALFMHEMCVATKMCYVCVKRIHPNVQ